MHCSAHPQLPRGLAPPCVRVWGHKRIFSCLFPLSLILIHSRDFKFSFLLKSFLGSVALGCRKMVTQGTVSLASFPRLDWASREREERPEPCPRRGDEGGCPSAGPGARGRGGSRASLRWCIVRRRVALPPTHPQTDRNRKHLIGRHLRQPRGEKLGSLVKIWGKEEGLRDGGKLG